MNKTIIKIDASALKSGACDWALWATVIEGYKEPQMFNDTQYGVAFHTFASRMAESNNDFAEAHKSAMQVMRLPCKVRDRKKAHLTEKHLINTCTTYFSDVETKRSNFEYIINPQAKCWKCKGIGSIPCLAKDYMVREDTIMICPTCEGKSFRAQPLVEVTFSIQVYEDEQFIVYLCGTIDRIGKIRNGAYCIRDYKTTSTWDIDKYLAYFRCSVQFKLYLWALKRMAKDNPGTILDEITRFPMVAFIDGVFLKSAKDTEFHSSDAIQYKEWEYEEFESLLNDQIQRLLSIARGSLAVRNGKMLGLCYTGFYCKFHDVCHAIDNVVAEHVLKQNFIRKPYDPLNFRD